MVVTKLSPWSVKDTVARLKAIVEARGMSVFAVIDLSAEAGASRFDLRELQVITFWQRVTASLPSWQRCWQRSMPLPMPRLTSESSEATRHPAPATAN